MANAARARAIACVTLGAAALAITSACSDSNGPGDKTRSYMMGFSNFPPAPDTLLLRRTVEMWNTRSDAAIMHIDPPWAALLAGGDPDSLVIADVFPLRHAYAQLGKLVVIETDVTNGIDRTAESPALVALGRSITEDTVQKLYRRYVRAIAGFAGPDFLGLASETNLIRAASSSAVYAAVVAMTNAAAADLRPDEPGIPLYVSVQAEVAWGRLVGPAGVFVGVARDRTDFPFINVLGVSSYPYLAGFSDPSQVPDDYFSRLSGSPALKLLITEGGWSSANVGSVHSSPALQQAWIKRAETLLDKAHALGWFQLDFTDINLVAFGLPADDPQVAPFVHIGLVDTALSPKPALAEWDRVFARQRKLDLPCVGGCSP